MIIKGNKVNLAPFEYKDLKNKKYISWLNNKELLKFSNQRFENQNIKKLRNDFYLLKKNKNIFLKILTKENQFIGTIIGWINKNHKSCNLGILIGDYRFKSRGYGLDSWKTAMNYLFRDLKLRKVFAGTIILNKPMLSIFKKSKMKFEGKFKKHEIIGKKYQDLVYYSKFKK